MYVYVISGVRKHVQSGEHLPCGLLYMLCGVRVIPIILDLVCVGGASSALPMLDATSYKGTSVAKTDGKGHGDVIVCVCVFTHIKLPGSVCAFDRNTQTQSKER